MCSRGIRSHVSEGLKKGTKYYIYKGGEIKDIMISD